MADEKPGFLKRLFKFGKKNESQDELEIVEDATSDTVIGAGSEPDPVAHAEAAANVIADAEAGAETDTGTGIKPTDDVPPPPTSEETEREEAAARAAKEAEERKREADEQAAHEAEEAICRAQEEEQEEREAKERAEREKLDQEETQRVTAEKKAAEEDRRRREEERLAGKQTERDTAAAEENRRTDEQPRRVAEEENPGGVFEAPGETNTAFDGDTPEPLSDTPEPSPAPSVEEGAKRKLSWFNRLKGGLSRSSTQLTESITGVFTKRKLDEDTLQDLEDILIRADLGVETAMSITDNLSSQRMGKDVSSEEVRSIMADEIEAVLELVAAELELDLDHQPHVILVVGVNGSGKTTTIGKLSQKLYDAGFSTLLVAGDTFRAAAIEQLKIWGDRTQSPVLSRPLGSDAAGLAYDAYEQAKAESHDVMLMDTAGRLQNRTELMDELAKIVRVLKKQDLEAPHTVLLTLDATTGQNALNQVEIFKDVAGVNGIVMTKLDGTARGGILVAISAKHKLPVFFLGVGEQVDDLEPFEARDFARSIAGFEA